MNLKNNILFTQKLFLENVSIILSFSKNYKYLYFKLINYQSFSLTHSLILFTDNSYFTYFNELNLFTNCSYLILTRQGMSSSQCMNYIEVFLYMD